VNIKKLSEVKILIGVIAFFLMAGVSLAGWFKLPKRVEKVEKKSEKTENNVQKLSANLDKYIAINEVQQEADKEHKRMMLEIIKELKDK